MRYFTLALALFLALPAWGQQRGQAPPFGEYKGDLKDEQGVIMRVALKTPSRMHPAKKIGLFLAHHGMNGNESGVYRGMVEDFQRTKLSEEYILISGKSKGAGWDINVDADLTKRVIAWAQKHYPVDPRRVYMWGSSNGASYSGRFGWANQDLIAGVIGYCGGYNFKAEPPPESPGDTRTEFYFVHGDTDDQVDVASARRGAGQLRAMGYRYVYRELDGYGHGDIYRGKGNQDSVKLVTAIRDDYIRWIHTLRHKQIEPVKKEKEFLDQLQGKRAESLLRRKTTYVKLALLGGPVAGAAMVKGLQSETEGTRAGAAAASELSRLGTKVTQALAGLAEDEKSRVRLAAIKALGTYAAWNDAPALAGLCKVASTKPEKKGQNSKERILAIAGLAGALPLAIPGNYEEKQLFWTLVMLLDDEDARIRSAAFQALVQAVPDGLGYSPKLSDKVRPGPLAKWKAWVTEKCGPLEN